MSQTSGYYCNFTNKQTIITLVIYNTHPTSMPLACLGSCQSMKWTKNNSAKYSVKITKQRPTIYY